MAEFTFLTDAKIREIKLISFKVHPSIGVLKWNYVKFGA